MAKENGKPVAEGKSAEVQSTSSAFLTSGRFYSIQSVPGIGAAIGSPVYAKTLPDTSEESGTFATFDESAIGFRIGGVARVRWVPTLGIATNMSDPLNQAAQSLYNRVQDKMNNRNLPFQGVDLLKLIVSQDSAHILYQVIYRAFRTLGMADIANDYLPQGLFRAYRFNYSDFRDNKPLMREDLAYWREMLTTRYAMPKVFKLNELHSQMSRFIYADSNSRKAQLYVCMPSCIWTWEAEDEDFQLTSVDITGFADSSTSESQLTYAAVRKIMYDLIDAMLNSTDFQRIQAALMTTFSDAGIVELPDPLVDDVVPFVFDEGFNNALQNASIVGLTNASDLTLHDTGDNLLTVSVTVPVGGSQVVGATTSGIQRNCFADYASIAATNTYLNLSKDTPTAEEMTNYARWKAWVVEDPDSLTNMSLATMSTELITKIDIIWCRSNAYFATQDIYDVGSGTPEAGANVMGPFSYKGAIVVTQDGYDDQDVQDLDAAGALGGEGVRLDYYLIRRSVLDAFDYMPPETTCYIVREGGSVPQYIRGVAPMVHWHFYAVTTLADVRAYHKAILWSALLEG